MSQIITKLTQLMLRTFFRWKLGYRTKIIFLQLWDQTLFRDLKSLWTQNVLDYKYLWIYNHYEFKIFFDSKCVWTENLHGPKFFKGSTIFWIWILFFSSNILFDLNIKRLIKKYFFGGGFSWFTNFLLIHFLWFKFFCRTRDL